MGFKSIESLDLSDDEVKCLAVAVPNSDEPVMIPLFSQLPREKMQEMGVSMKEDAEKTLDSYFRGYLGDYVDKMPIEKWNLLINTWMAVSQENSGATPGE